MRRIPARFIAVASFLLPISVLVCALPAQAGPFTRLQVLLPGENAAPGTASGKTGSPAAQTAGVPFSVTVRACDDQWNTVSTVTDAIQILCSDASATLPSPSQLSGGTASFSVTFNAGGSFSVYAHDQTDGTIPDGVSASVSSLVLSGFVFSRITQKNQYAGAPLTVTVTAVNPSGATVSGYNGAVRLSEITSYGDGRVSPETVTLSNGTWTGAVTMYRADETSINRGNVNLYAYLESAPSKNGTSDPFTVHPGPFTRVQIVVPGQTPLPGSVSGVTGSPASQSAGKSFAVSVYATDSWWNPVVSADNVRITSSDANANTPQTGTLSNGYRSFSVSFGTVGTQTLTVADLTSSSIQSMTSPGVSVIPSAADHFVVETIASPQTAGVPVPVVIRATDVSGNTVPGFAGDAVLTANTGAGSISPELISFTNGVWSGTMVFRGAGGSVALTCSDFSSPPHTGTSNSFTVSPGPFVGLQVLVPGESPRGGTADGREGTPSGQSAGALFTVTVRAVDAYWNLVSGVNDHVSLASSDAFATLPADTALANGQILVPARLFRTGPQRIWASDLTSALVRPDTSSAITVTGGPFSRVLVLAPGESPAPGTATGRTGTATDQSINYAFTLTVLATDAWWNPVTGVNDVVHFTTSDAGATLPADGALTDGVGEFVMRLSTGGFQQISVSDVTQPNKTGSSTQVKAINSGFHLEAFVSSQTARAGEPFTLTVRVTNDAGSVIQEVNSFVTIEVQNASSQNPGRGTLLTTQFQLLQGQRAVSETYTFTEPIVLIARDDAGNAPGITGVIDIRPGPPSAIRLTSVPSWVGGNKHGIVYATLVDAFENGVPGEVINFSLQSGTGTLTSMDSLTSDTGVSRADFLSARTPEFDRIRATWQSITAEMDLQTAFVNPAAAGGYVTNYPNPFHPGEAPTTVAYKLDDAAEVTIRIFTQNGDLVYKTTFPRGDVGGRAGLNEWQWDGRNGMGTVVSTGGYILLVEAAGTGETLHVMRRKIAVVR